MPNTREIIIQDVKTKGMIFQKQFMKTGKCYSESSDNQSGNRAPTLRSDSV